MSEKMHIIKELANFRDGSLIVEGGSRHCKVRNIVSRDWIPIPGTPSDWRSLRNFRHALRRLASRGEGFIYAKTGHLPG